MKGRSFASGSFLPFRTTPTFAQFSLDEKLGKFFNNLYYSDYLFRCARSVRRYLGQRSRAQNIAWQTTAHTKNEEVRTHMGGKNCFVTSLLFFFPGASLHGLIVRSRCRPSFPRAIYNGEAPPTRNYYSVVVGRP